MLRPRSIQGRAPDHQIDGRGIHRLFICRLLTKSLWMSQSGFADYFGLSPSAVTNGINLMGAKAFENIVPKKKIKQLNHLGKR